ncbi:type II secretion system F family protein, partial [Streptomyces sp. SID2119]
GEELARVARRLAVGESLDEALSELTDRLPSRELVVLVTTLVLSNRAGGTVVSSLRNLTETLEERKETRREVKTQLSQVTVTAYAVPAFGIGAMLLMNAVMPGALDRMTGAFIGQAAVVVAIALYAIGFVVIRRLSRIDV